MKTFRQIYGISPSEYEQRFIDQAANNAGEPSTASSARSCAVEIVLGIVLEEKTSTIQVS
jgi:hypothetical protein